MAKNLSPWCKTAQKAMIDKELNINDVAARLKCTRQYAWSLVNGRMYSQGAIRKISKMLEISEPDETTVLKHYRAKES